MSPTTNPARQAGDEGSVLLLIIGLSVVLLLLVAVVVDVSAVILAKRGVSSAADGAAVVAAQQPSRPGIDDGGLEGGQRLPLDLLLVQDVVELYRVDALDGRPDLEMSADLEGTSTAVVTAQRLVKLPFSGWLDVGNPTVTAVSRARSPLAP